MRTHATTVSLCTSRPAQRGYITSMTSSPVAPPAWGTSIGNSIKRAPDREGHWHNQGCSKYPRSNSLSGSQHHDDDRPLCRRPPSLASVSSSRVGRSRCVTHSITSSAPAAEPGLPGLSGRTLISRVIGPHPAPACWGVSVACQEPAAGALISVNQKYGGPPWRSREGAGTLPSGPLSESSP